MSSSKREEIEMVYFSIVEDDFDELLQRREQSREVVEKSLLPQQTQLTDLEKEGMIIQDTPRALGKQTQQKVNDIIDLMIDNVDRVMERDEQCAVLDGRDYDLEIGAVQFGNTTQRLTRKKRNAHLKSSIILGMVGLVLIVIILMAI